MSVRRAAGSVNMASNTTPFAAVAGYGAQMMGVAGAEVRKLRHDPWELLSRAVQPILWLVLFGGVMARVRGLSIESMPYLDFLTPGILAQSVLFVAIFYGISAIWERDLGVLHRYMVSPAPRSAIVIGKGLSSSVRGLSQAIVIYLCAAVMGVHLNLAGASVPLIVLLILLGSALFSTFSLIVACIVKTRERFMGIGQVLTMPIFFASNAIYPIGLMPRWLQIVSSMNPLTYEVDGLRALMLRGATSKYGLDWDIAILFTVTAVLVAVAARLYPRMTE